MEKPVTLLGRRVRFGECISIKDWSRTSEEGLHEGSELHDCVARISDTATNQHVEASPQDRNLGEEFVSSYVGAVFENDDDGLTLTGDDLG